jgi:hypothetical protein
LATAFNTTATGLSSEESPSSRRPGREVRLRTEHFAPLFVTLGAAEAEFDTQRSVIDGFWLGMAKRSIQIG